MTYTRFTEIADTGKTKVWAVDNVNDGSHLGVIKWHGPWRKYVLRIEEKTIWSADCLRDVVEFIEKRMAERSLEQARRKDHVVIPLEPNDLTSNDGGRTWQRVCEHGETGPHDYEVAGERGPVDGWRCPGPPAAPERCCDMHNKHCEPTRWKCCPGCPEYHHGLHADEYGGPVRASHHDGSTCVLDTAPG